MTASIPAGHGRARDGSDSPESIEAAYAVLGPEAARIYRLFGVHPGDALSVDAVAAACHLTGFAAQKLLDGLTMAGLAEETTTDNIDDGAGTYRLHPPALTHARGLAATDPDRKRLWQRLAEWFLDGTFAAGRRLTPYRQDPPAVFTVLPRNVVVLDGRDQALDWLELELDNLQAVITALEEDQPLLAYQIAWGMWPVFHLLRQHTVRQRVDEIMVRCAVRLDHPPRIIEAWCRAGWGHYDRGEYADAVAVFGQAQDLCARSGDKSGAASAASGMGMTALALGHTDDAYQLLRDQEAVFAALRAHRAAGIAAYRIGLVHAAGGAHPLALTALTRAVTVLREGAPPDLYHLHLAGIAQARALIRCGRPDEAKAVLLEALREMTVLRSLHGQAEALLGLAEHAIDRGDTRLVYRRLAHAAECYAGAGDHADVALVHRLIAAHRPAVPGRPAGTAL
ncbi:hypothetical protein [Catenuloplanes japonicus]|uniref:hypothetical protein n=1 Tax=Catenuloplanes japonicus TaxID=33876 RepID=UPI000526EA0C|nr:hypothetical protein [Catenuloplanes japonicus]